MPRRPRLKLGGVPLHVVQRGNNRAACFFADEDYCCYLHWLRHYATQYGCAVHAYVLMTNHVHLLLTPVKADAASKLLQSLGRRYVQYVNHCYRRSGTLWEGRFKASLVQAEEYLLACQRYIELNPVRADMVSHPRDYPWSSYAAHAEGARNDLLTPHPLYLALGGNEDARRDAYQALFRSALDPDLLNAIRKATQRGLVLGNDRFKEEIEAALGKKIGPKSKGRPRHDEQVQRADTQTSFGFQEVH
jgi:putative transposase